MLNYYYPRTIRTVTMAIVDVFNDIVVYNYEDAISGSTSAASSIRVPIKFGMSDKRYLSRKEEESGLRYMIQLPEISLLIRNFDYSSDRANSTSEIREFHDPDIALHDQDQFFEDVQPTPYDYRYELKIRTNSMDHLCQIAEQVLPYFDPSITLRVKEFSFFNIERDVNLSLEGGLNIEYPEPIDENSRREFLATLNLTAKGFFYHPTTRSKIIKYINSRFYINQVDVSGSGSQYNKLVSHYSTSGYEGYETSAFPRRSQYETSAYNELNDVYVFTSGSSYF